MAWDVDRVLAATGLWDGYIKTGLCFLPTSSGLCISLNTNKAVWTLRQFGISISQDGLRNTGGLDLKQTAPYTCLWHGSPALGLAPAGSSASYALYGSADACLLPLLHGF